MKIQLIVVFIYFVYQISGRFVNENNCGIKRSGIQYYIVGGTNAQTNEFPFMASLQFKGKHFCGATILNKRWVLTAAHCIQIPKLMGRFKGPNDINIIMGSVDVDDIKAVKHNVSKWIINGCFMRPFSSDKMDGDMTLLMTAEDIDLSQKNIGTICLPPKEAEPIGLDIEVIGWGVATETHSIGGKEKVSQMLQKTTGQILSEVNCVFALYFRNLGIMNFEPGKRICFRSPNATVCRGDSGGPAFQIIDGRVYQFGVASFISMTIPLNTCAKGNPVFYTKVTHYIDWISNSIEKYEKSSESDIKTDC